MTTETQAPDPAPAPEPTAFVHWPLNGPPRLVWYSNKALHDAIEHGSKARNGYVPDLKLYAAIPAPEGAQLDERKAFEDAAADDGTLMSLENPWVRNARGDYDNAFVQTAWKFWNAHAALAAPAPQAADHSPDAGKKVGGDQAPAEGDDLDRDEAIRVWRRHCDKFSDALKKEHQGGFQDQRGKARNKPTLNSKEAAATPVEFRDLLINLARGARLALAA